MQMMLSLLLQREHQEPKNVLKLIYKILVLIKGGEKIWR